MGRDSVPIKVAANGRMSIPAKQRKALGIEKGGTVVATLQDGELRIRTVEAMMDEISAMVAPILRAPGGVVGSIDRRPTSRIRQGRTRLSGLPGRASEMAFVSFPCPIGG
jgi:AbrB family looped-hinge helix DNA binding protein